MTKVVLKIYQNSQESTYVGASKETPTQVFSCEFCDILRNIYSEEHLRITVSKLYYGCKFYVNKKEDHNTDVLL